MVKILDYDLRDYPAGTSILRTRTLAHNRASGNSPLRLRNTKAKSCADQTPMWWQV